MDSPDLLHDLDVASRALDEGDPRHALKHLAGAFSVAPNDERVHAVLETVAARTDILKNLPDDSFFGTHVVRAFALRRVGRVDEAVVALAQVTEALGDRGFETLLASWLVAHHAAGGKLAEKTTEQVTRVLSAACRSTIGINRLADGEQALLQGYFELAEALAAWSVTPLCASMIAGMRRRAGRFESALEVLAAGGRVRDEFALIQQGLVLRAMGEQARAADAFAAALAVDPAAGKLVVEQARCWFVAGDFERALRLLASVPEQEDAEMELLAQACRARPATDRLKILDGIHRDTVASAVDTPGDATANMFRQYAADLVPGEASIKVGISGWESPSNRLLVALYTTGTTDVVTATYDMAPVELEFDPMSHRRGDALPLWIEREGVVVQARPAPAAELRSAIGRIAAAKTGQESLWDTAAAFGVHLDPSLAQDIADALIHPPTDKACSSVTRSRGPASSRTCPTRGIRREACSRA